MANVIKKVKIKKEDDTYTDYIPIGADAKNVTTKNGDSVEDVLGNINLNEDGNIKEQLDAINKKQHSADGFELCGSYNVIKAGTLDQLFTVAEKEQHIAWWDEANIKKCSLSLNVCPLRAERLEYEAGTRAWEDLHWTTVPSIAQLTEHFQLLDRKGINCYHIKFHANWLRDTVPDTVSIDTKCNKFRETVLNFMQNVNHHFEWIGIFNEWGASYIYSNMVNFINELKVYGKVCLEGDRGVLNYPNLIEAVDGFCPHFYAGCGQLGADTDLAFAKRRMEEWYVFDRMRTWCQVSNKPILLGEGGCNSYWNGLAYPEQWSFTDELIANGGPQELWLRAAIDLLSDYKDRIIYFNWWWRGLW